MKKRISRLACVIMAVMMLMGMTAVSTFANETTETQYTVTFHDPVSGNSEDRTVNAGDTVDITCPFPAPGAEGEAVFQCWNNSGTYYFNPFKPTGTMQLDAVWHINKMSANITLPVEGNVPDNSASSSSDLYSIYNVTWQHKDGTPMSQSEKFEAGEEYKVVILFMPVDGATVYNTKVTIGGNSNTTKLNSSGGYSYEATFTAADSPVKPDSGDTDDSDVTDDTDDTDVTDDSDKEDKEASAKTEEGSDDSPKTGNDFNANMWLSLMALCALVAAEVYTFRKPADSEK